jgi:hypothetical protein
MRLGDKGGDAGPDVHTFSTHTPAHVTDLADQTGDFECVLIGLGRKPEHEIQFDAVPAIAEGRLGRTEEILLVDTLVDDVAQALATGLRRKGKAGLALLLDEPGEFDGERVDAQ